MWSFQNLLFTIYIALRCVTSAGEVIHVTGYMGSIVQVSCSYDEGYESYEKYLCKNDCGDSDVLITTSESWKRKYRINDDKTARIFTTTISDLHSTDAGKYWCGVTRNGKDIYTEVELKLVPDRCCDTVTIVHSYEGYSESISCPYDSQYQNNFKYICRGNRPSTCLQQALITSNKRENGRFRLDDEKMLRKFTVAISNLTQNDSGSYLCGVQRNSDLDVFSAIELKVKEWCCIKSTKVTGTAGHPLTLQCPYPSQNHNNRKFLCKGDHRHSCRDMAMSESRLALRDDIYSSSFSVTFTKIQVDDAGTYWCGSDSQWRVGNHVKIQLSVVSPQHTSTVPSTMEIPGKTTTHNKTTTQNRPNKDAGQYVVYAVPAVLLLLICALVVTVYQCKHQKVKDGKAVMNRNAENEEGLEEVTTGAENNIYGNEEVVRYKQQSACNNYDDAGEDEPDYENFTTSEEVYCNENFHRR
ncbi:polymeric immunoglobulin receptor-like [Neolamprologus brichardi]|uniref:polymeric immunoglobulin receptor-like n=1 Tax=Neolamprologus brichardi TaxID=32507 RepID=UPI001643BB57|nr:polymeric immunoglobulin receptor-like [Neolamprologus brichardi]